MTRYCYDGDLGHDVVYVEWLVFALLNYLELVLKNRIVCYEQSHEIDGIESKTRSKV